MTSQIRIPKQLRRIAWSSLLFLALQILLTSDVSAQLVQIGRFGGVRIRVPFVSVDVAPGGATRVRAPFTSVNTPGYGIPVYPSYPTLPRRPYYGPTPIYHAPAPVYPHPGYGTPLTYSPLESQSYFGHTEPSGTIETTQANSFGNSVIAPAKPRSVIPSEIQTGDDTLLRASAIRLEQSLAARGEDAEVWITYLNPKAIVNLVDSEPNESAKFAERLRNFDGVVANPELRWLVSLPGFAETRQQLHRRVGASPSESLLPIAEPSVSSNAIGDAIKPGISEPLLLPTPDRKTNEPTPATPLKPADGKDSQIIGI